jgi:hypothetical protein
LHEIILLKFESAIAFVIGTEERQVKIGYDRRGKGHVKIGLELE